MGFWSSVGKKALDVGKKAMDETQKKTAEINNLKSEYRNYDDEQLKAKVKSGSSNQKMAASSLLKERGYGN